MPRRTTIAMLAAACLAVGHALPMRGQEAMVDPVLPPTEIPGEPTEVMESEAPVLPQAVPFEEVPDAVPWQRQVDPPAMYVNPIGSIPPGTDVIVSSTVSTSTHYLGITLQPVDETLRSHLRLEPQVGLVVCDVVEGSPAHEVGLQRHDVITAADEQPIKGHDQLVQAVQQAGSEDRALVVALIRAGAPQTVTVKPARRGSNSGTMRARPGDAPTPAGAEAAPVMESILPRSRPPQIDGPRDSTQNQQDLQQQIELLRREVDDLRRAMQQPAVAP